jgi:hypothetical protein
MARHIVVDPRFGSRMRELRDMRGCRFVRLRAVRCPTRASCRRSRPGRSGPV